MSFSNEEFVVRNDWRRDEVLALFSKPFNDLLYEAQSMHRRFFDPNSVQLSTLLSIKIWDNASQRPAEGNYSAAATVNSLIGSAGLRFIFLPHSS